MLNLAHVLLRTESALSTGGSGPPWVLGPHNPHPKQNLDQFSHFTIAPARGQQTDRQTTLQRQQQAASYAMHSDAI